MTRLLLLTAIFLTACDSNIPFDVQGSSHVYLGCKNNQAEFDSKWRNVILDKTNGSARSEWFFLDDADDFRVLQHGQIGKLYENSNKSAYEWGDYNNKFRSDRFAVDKTSLRLDHTKKYNYSAEAGGVKYKTDNYSCELKTDYEAYSKWESSVRETLDIVSRRFRAEAKVAEAAKKI